MMWFHQGIRLSFCVFSFDLVTTRDWLVVCIFITLGILIHLDDKMDPFSFGGQMARSLAILGFLGMLCVFLCILPFCRYPCGILCVKWFDALVSFLTPLSVEIKVHEQTNCTMSTNNHPAAIANKNKAIPCLKWRRGVTIHSSKL